MTGNRVKIRHGSWSGPVKVQPELYNRKQDKAEVVFELTPFAGYHDKLVVDMAAGTAPERRGCTSGSSVIADPLRPFRILRRGPFRRCRFLPPAACRVL